MTVSDRYGPAVTTNSVEAGEFYSQALDLKLELRQGAQPLLEGAVAADSEFALAWSMLGGQLRSAGDIAGGNAMIERATALAVGGTDRERSHVLVYSLFAGSRFADARTAAVAHLDSWPGDVLILMYAHYLFNLLISDPDRRVRHLELVSSVAAAVPDDWYVLGELAFAATRADGDVSDGASLMWRLSLAGQTDLPWEVLACGATPSGFVFDDYHRALVLAGTNDLDGLSELSRELRAGAVAGLPAAGTCAESGSAELDRSVRNADTPIGSQANGGVPPFGHTTHLTGCRKFRVGCGGTRPDVVDVNGVACSTSLILLARGSSPQAIDTWRHVCLRSDTCLHVSPRSAIRTRHCGDRLA